MGDKMTLLDILEGQTEIEIRGSIGREDEINQYIIEQANILGVSGFRIMSVHAWPVGWGSENITIKAIKVKP